MPLGEWGSPNIFRRQIQLALEQRQPALVDEALRAKPSQFTEEEWQDLRERMNIAELGDAPLPNSRSRTQAEANALLAKRIELSPSVIDDYVGVYKSVGFRPLEFFRKGEGLWVKNANDPVSPGGEAIAVAENQFELFPLKGYRYRFIERDAQEYDLEATDGQLVRYYRRIDDE
ncbi:MAG: hypothetical protein O7G84_12590 [Gammaproteobacteria bacterium]|nr:hypothetical protein [Gammaproteobacteria bacterium]